MLSVLYFFKMRVFHGHIVVNEGRIIECRVICPHEKEFLLFCTTRLGQNTGIICKTPIMLGKIRTLGILLAHLLHSLTQKTCFFCTISCNKLQVNFTGFAGKSR